MERKEQEQKKGFGVLHAVMKPRSPSMARGILRRNFMTKSEVNPYRPENKLLVLMSDFTRRTVPETFCKVLPVQCTNQDHREVC